METRKRRIQTNKAYQPGEPPKPLRLTPQPGEIWAALVDDEAIAYGKTLEEARDRALELRPDVEPVMDLIAWLWDIGFFQEPGESGNVERAVWIPRI
jgi:hypothetical protein